MKTFCVLAFLAATAFAQQQLPLQIADLGIASNSIYAASNELFKNMSAPGSSL